MGKVPKLIDRVFFLHIIKGFMIWNHMRPSFTVLSYFMIMIYKGM